MKDLNKVLPKVLTIEDLKQRIGKPIFVVGLTYGNKEWRVLKASGFAVANTLEFTDSSKITEEHQGNFKFFDEEVTALELKEILEAEEKLKRKTGYERVEIEKNYYTITSTKEIADMREYDAFNTNNEKRYNMANYFNDENLAKNIARAEQLKYQLRRFAALNGGITSVAEWFSYSSWEDGCNWKYSIQYNYENQKMQINCTLTNKCFGQIYFKEENACKKAVETFKEELIWYFTEFEEQLY